MTKHNINSWCQKYWVIQNFYNFNQDIWFKDFFKDFTVSNNLDLKDLTFAELFYGLWTSNNFQNYCLASLRFTNWTPNTTFLELFSTISSMRGEIYEQEVNLDNLLSFHGNTCSRYPSQGTQVTLTQDKETKKVWTLQPKPSQARGAAWGAAQARCRSAALPSDYITPPVALEQHCSTEEQQAAAAAGRLRSISLVCRLHNTITLNLTAVKSKSRASVNIHVLL